MTPGQHFIISWVCANIRPVEKRGRLMITLAGLAPDLDGFGYPIDKLGPYLGYSSNLYEEWHHYLGHNIFFGLALCLAMAWSCRERYWVFFGCLLAFHLHLLGDLIGSRGPDGYQWPIPYLYPLFPEISWSWSGQWELSAWQNSAIGLGVFAIALILTRYRHVTFFELFSNKFEQHVCHAARQRGWFK